MAEKIIVVGMLDGGVYANMHEQSRRVYDPKGIAPTQHTCGGGNLETKIIEPTICAMRGRNPDNPSDRTRGIPLEQRLEIGGSVSNTLTSVQKDNLVAEPIAKKKYCNGLLESGSVSEGDVIHHNYTASRQNKRSAEVTKGVCPTLDTRSDCLGVCQDYRIRKLTPRECFRLMDFDDEDFLKVKCKLINDDETAQWFLEQESKVNARTMTRQEWKIFSVYLRKRYERTSDSQCYKQAGNSIVVAVLEAIFKQML